MICDLWAGIAVIWKTFRTAPQLLLTVKTTRFWDDDPSKQVVLFDKSAQKIKMLKVLFVIRRILHISGK